MLLLGLDTATLTLSAALVEREGGTDRLVERMVVPPPKHHSTVLPGVLEEMLTRAGKSIRDVGALVVGLGPGSFTGLRIGLATAKGLCYAAKVPLVGASSLGAMALAAASEVGEGELLVPCMDARKGEIYCAFFRREGEGVRQEQAEVALAPEALVERLKDEPRFHVFGPGRNAYEPLRNLPPPASSVETPDAFALVKLVKELPPFDVQKLFALERMYVRPPEHEWTIRQKKK